MKHHITFRISQIATNAVLAAQLEPGPPEGAESGEQGGGTEEKGGPESGARGLQRDFQQKLKQNCGREA